MSRSSPAIPHPLLRLVVPLFIVSLLLAAPPARAQSLTVDAAKKHQTITGLGTCGMHWTGGDLYANKEIQARYVEDLGATILRFAVPPNVLPKEVADPKDISYKNFVFDKASQSATDYVGAIYALNPKEMTVVASVWSPPGWMKTTGKTAGGGSLKPDRIPHYAKYLAEWALYLQQVQKTPLRAVSIQNELSFKEPYDSCVYTADLYRDTALATCDAFKAAAVDTKIFGPEYMTWAADKILKFITPVLKDPRGKDRFLAAASHGYVDGVQPAGTAQESAKLWQALQPLGVPWWMSETSGEQPSLIGEGKDKKGAAKTGALSLANCIHNALVYGNASAWIYWCYSGHSKTPTDAAAGEALMNGLQPTKKYFVSKQFYRFIRPGAARVDAGPDGENQLQISAYLHEKNRTLTVVLLNHDTKEAAITLAIKNAPAVPTFQTYRTSESEDCAKLPDTAVSAGKVTLTLPAQSVTTLFGTAR